MLRFAVVTFPVKDSPQFNVIHQKLKTGLRFSDDKIVEFCSKIAIIFHQRKDTLIIIIIPCHISRTSLDFFESLKLDEKDDKFPPNRSAEPTIVLQLETLPCGGGWSFNHKGDAYAR